MEQQEWQEYVQKVATSEYPVPIGMIADYDDWRCRSIVGRMLYILKDIEGAMAVLSTVKDVQPNMEDAPEYGLSEAEHKVLCLRDIAEIVWTLTGTAYGPLIYLKEADKICRAYKNPFRSTDRGYIWAHRLEIMRSCGEDAKAIAEAAAMLEAEKNNAGINPYRYHALKFLAESAAAQSDFAKGAELLAEAYKYFPLNPAGEADIAEAAATEDPKERYEKYHHCTTIQYLPWEKTNTPTLEEGRQRHYERVLERQAKAAEGKDAETLATESLINRLK